MLFRRSLALLTLLLTLAAGLPAQAEIDRCPSQARTLEVLEDFQAALPSLPLWVRFFFGRWIRFAVNVVSTRYADDCVAVNQVQVIGTHNSYHIQPVPSLIEFYLAFDPTAPELEYSHRPLAEQLDRGVRQFELDVFADPEGGLYSEPIGLALREMDPEARIDELDAPGVKVLHIQDIDWDTTCYTLIECLEEIEAWSDANPRHLPIFVMIEAKDEFMEEFAPLGFTEPIPWDEAQLDVMDAEIRSALPAAKLITPDMLRGDFDSLEEAVLTRGWPNLGEARGKIIVALCGKRDEYRGTRANLEGRVAFVDATPGDGDTAFVKVNEPRGNEALIQDMVAAGYLVRTRSDAGTFEARNNDTAKREAAFASAAHFVSTDYIEPDPFDGNFVVRLPGDRSARCNPVSAPAGCRDDALER